MGRFSRAGCSAIDLARIAMRATESGPHRYRHGWIPTSPIAVLPSGTVDEEYGAELDSVDFDDTARIVARQHGVTVESDLGDDVAIHATPSGEDATRWADAIDSGEIYVRPRFATEPHAGGTSVRFGDHEADLDNDEAADVAQGLRDMAYQVEDAARPDEPDVYEPPGDETPMPDTWG